MDGVARVERVARMKRSGIREGVRASSRIPPLRGSIRATHLKNGSDPGRERVRDRTDGERAKRLQVEVLAQGVAESAL
jgi:hypothetical protein